MEINEKVKVEIVDVSHDGLGVAKVDGYTLFVDEALPGEKVLVEITEMCKNYGFAKNVGVIHKSPYRVKPVCSHFGVCGGCELMHLEYKQQLQYKWKLA